MRILVLHNTALALAVASLVSGSAAAQSAGSDTAEIRTSATVHRQVRPDLAVLTIQFTAEDSTPRRAGARLAARADSLRRAFMALGIPRDSMLTRSSWSWYQGRMEIISRRTCVPSTDPRVPCTPFTDTLYRGREIMEIRIRDLRRIGAVIDTAMARGIIEFSPLQFRATDTREAQEDALREATALAHRRAELLATASGGRLGPVIFLSTEAGSAGRYGMEEIVVTARGDDVPTEVVAPSLSVAATVSGRWRLLPRP